MPTGLGDEQLWLSATNDNTGTSTAFDDQSGNGNNGTAAGTLVVADTSEGGSYAFDFDGVNDRIGCGNAVTLASNLLSVSTWINGALPTTNGVFRTLVSKGNTSTITPFDLSFRGTGSSTVLRFFTYNGTLRGITSYVTTMSSSQWYHVCGTYDNQTFRLYIDGVEVATAAWTGGLYDNSEDIFIGSFAIDGATQRYFDGTQDDLRLFNRALTQSEITHLASSRGVEGPPPVGLGDEQLWLCPSINDSANDISGNGNDGTYQNGMGTIADTSNGGTRAYEFDGSNDYITYPVSAISSAASVGSVSAWVNTTSTANAGGAILGGSRTAANTFWSHLRIDGGKPTLVTVANGVSSEKEVDTDTVNDGAWHHVVAIGDGAVQSFYIDGVLVSSSPVGTAYQDRWLGYPASMDTGLIGSLVRASGTGNLWDGRMDDIRAYNRVLTQAEITHLASQRGVEGPPPVGLGDEKLWLCPSLNDSANDISGNGNNGTYSGGMGTIADTGEGGSYAYDFDGVNDYIDTSNVLGLGSGDFSISFWVKSSSSSQGTLLSTYNATNGKWVSTEFNGDIDGGTDVGKVRAGIDDNTAKRLTSTYTASYNDGTWRHFVVERNNTDGKLRVRYEGISVSSVAIGGYGDITSTVPLRLGSNNTVSSGFFDGVMDDIRIYNRALTQSEITHLASQRGVEGPPPVGLGDEQLWLCPSLNDSPVDLSSNGSAISYFNGLTTTADTTSGGSRAYDYDAGIVGVDCGDILDSEVWTTGSPFTITGWGKVGSDGVVILSKLADVNSSPSSSNNREFLFQARDTGTGMKVDFAYYPTTLTSNTYRVFQTASTVSVGTWYHFAVVYNGPTATNSNPSIYVNGVAQSVSLNFTAGTDNGPMLDGAASVATGLALEGANYVSPRGGRSDDTRVYSRTLTQSEITHLATSRGIEGSPTFTGLGDEQLWLCPSLDDSANDISGYGRNGTYQGSAATIADTSNGGSRAFDFRVSGSFVDCGNVLDAPSQFSISAWVNRGTRADTAGIAGKWTGNTGYMVYNNTPQVAIDGGPHTTGSTQIPASTWQHLCATYDGTTINLYQDGTLTSTQAHAPPSTTAATYQIGAYNSGTFRSLMDDVRQYNRALTQAEITHLATSRGIEGSPSGPTAQYNAFLTHAFKQLFQTRLR